MMRGGPRERRPRTCVDEFMLGMVSQSAVDTREYERSMSVAWDVDPSEYVNARLPALVEDCDDDVESLIDDLHEEWSDEHCYVVAHSSIARLDVGTHVRGLGKWLVTV